MVLAAQAKWCAGLQFSLAGQWHTERFSAITAGAIKPALFNDFFNSATSPVPQVIAVLDHAAIVDTGLPIVHTARM
jgi:hypothetical protein